MAKIQIADGKISSSADYSLYHGTTKVADIKQNAISGSSSSTGSFGRVEGTVDFGDIVIDNDEIPIAKLASDSVSYGGITVTLGASDATPAFDLSDATAYTGDSSLVTTGTVTSGIWNSTFGSTANTIISGSANAANISGSLGTNASLIRSLTAANISGSFEGGGSTKISGSSTSTGSFGSAHIADKVGIGVTSPAAKLDVSGSVFPEGDNFHDLGSAAKRWANLYVGDMQLNNKGSGGNEVDGTEGNWSLQEGEENLYVINRKTGKKFKIKLEEM